VSPVLARCTNSKTSPIFHAGALPEVMKFHVFVPTPLAPVNVMALCTGTEFGASGREIARRERHPSQFRRPLEKTAVYLESK
jgi:hypothetical protein